MPYKDKKKERASWRRYYYRHKDNMKRRRDKQRSLVGTFIKEYKDSQSCSQCGEDHPGCLEFHHLDPSKKDRIIAEAMARRWSINRLKKEMEKCAVLCANCHRKLHYTVAVA